MKIAAVVLALLGVWCCGAASATAALPDLAFRPHPGALLPLDATLVDEAGRPVPLASFFAGKPVVLVFEYLQCRTLCGLTLEKLVDALDGLPLEPGRDFQLVAMDIDPRDRPADAAAAKAGHLARYRHDGGGSGFHFLTGTDAAVRRIADAAGFPYLYDPAVGQYIHPAGFVIAAPDGRIARYVFNVAPSAGDLGAALGEAAQGKTTALDPVTRLLLLCHLEGVPLGHYSVAIEAALAVANLAGLAALVVVFATIKRRRRAG